MKNILEPSKQACNNIISAMKIKYPTMTKLDEEYIQMEVRGAVKTTLRELANSISNFREVFMES
jgi:hypothetical protein